MAVASSIAAAAAVWFAFLGPRSAAAQVRHPVDAPFWGLATSNGFVVFLAWNTEKLLLGRFWGSDALGMYGRAYQLVTLPVLQLNGAVTGVAFPHFRGFSMIPSALLGLSSGATQCSYR